MSQCMLWRMVEEHQAADACLESRFRLSRRPPLKFLTAAALLLGRAASRSSCFAPNHHHHHITAMMPGLKRKPSLGSSKPTASSSEASSSKKKARSDAAPAAAPPSTLVDSSQVDFPRGGGSGLTQFEHASTLREARAELAKSSRGGDDLFSDNKTSAKAKLSPEDEQKRKDAKRKMNREKNNAKKKKVSLVTEEPDKSKASKDHIRIEHLNYKVSASDALCQHTWN